MSSIGWGRSQGLNVRWGKEKGSVSCFKGTFCQKASFKGECARGGVVHVPHMVRRVCRVCEDKRLSLLSRVRSSGLAPRLLHGSSLVTLRLVVFLCVCVGRDVDARVSKEQALPAVARSTAQPLQLFSPIMPCHLSHIRITQASTQPPPPIPRQAGDCETHLRTAGLGFGDGQERLAQAKALSSFLGGGRLATSIIHHTGMHMPLSCSIVRKSHHYHHGGDLVPVGFPVQQVDHQERQFISQSCSSPHTCSILSSSSTI